MIKNPSQPSSLPPNRLLAHMREGAVNHLYSLGNFATPRHVDFACGTGLFHSLWFDREHFDIPTQERAVLNMVARHDAEGFGSCSNEGECEAVCPKEISLTNIAKMNREYVRARITGSRTSS